MRPDSQDAVFAVLSTISPDRVGVVAAVTRFLAEHNANVEASHATRLAGFYGAQFLVSAAAAEMGRIEREYRDARDYSREAAFGIRQDIDGVVIRNQSGVRALAESRFIG